MSNRIELKLPALHPGQQKVLNEARRFNVLRAGRRFGKSTLGRHLLIHEALKRLPSAWISPSYKTMANQWRELVDILTPITTRKNEEERRLEIRGGGVIDFWSADGGHGMPGEGRKYSLIVFDEAAMVGADLERLWTRSLRPTLADYAPHSSAWFLSTSKAANAYFNQLFAYGQGEREDWKSWQFSTADNPHIAKSEIEAARRDLPIQAFNQEFLGEAVSFSGTVFTGLENAIVDAPLPDEYKQWQQPPRPWDDPGPRFYIGADWAGSGRSAAGDFTAFIVVAKHGGVLTVVDITRVKADYAAQRALLAGMVARYKPVAVIAESNSIGDPQIRALRSSGLHVQGWAATNASKHKGVESLALGFQQSKIRIPDIPNRSVLLAELMAYEATPLANGLTRFSAPPGGHDDLIMALLIVNLAVSQPRIGYQPGSLIA